MQASVPVVDWVYQSSAACLDILSRRPPHAMRISTTTRFDAHRKRLLDESRPRSKARRPPQLRHLPKDELHSGSIELLAPSLTRRDVTRERPRGLSPRPFRVLWVVCDLRYRAHSRELRHLEHRDIRGRTSGRGSSAPMSARPPSTEGSTGLETPGPS